MFAEPRGYNRVTYPRKIKRKKIVGEPGEVTKKLALNLFRQFRQQSRMQISTGECSKETIQGKALKLSNENRRGYSPFGIGGILLSVRIR